MTIEVSLTHRFASFVLDAAFRVERRGVTALFGPSGAGKSTIVAAIAGLLHPQRGRIAIDGHVVLDTANHIFTPAPARHMGCVFQDARLFPHMSVETNLRFGLRRSGRTASSEFAAIVELLGLESLLSRRPARLSGGEKSRVALGRALLASPDLLLLDEPLAALDAARKAEILPYLERLRDSSRLPMIYVTHAVDEMARLADTVILLRDGRVAGQGPVFDVLADIELGPFLPAFGAVFPAMVVCHRDDGLTELGFDGGALLVPRLYRAAGTRLRVRLRAEDVLLAREIPMAISANNILATQVTAVRLSGDHADVQLRSGGIRLVSRITRASLQRLDIAPFQSIYAVIKSVTVDPQLDALAMR
ncbi:MAG TPA: molybdenum ABC transporter ATP-binding protein [Rhizomicrobium sp.]|jgi:molybdate transport system ATP-binding protein